MRSNLPARVLVTEKEKNRLVRFAAKLGRALNEIGTIVHPDTLRRWMRELRGRQKYVPAKRGRNVKRWLAVGRFTQRQTYLPIVPLRQWIPAKRAQILKRTAWLVS